VKILVLSYLYPNSIYPHYGIFVHNRLKAVSRYHEVKVINPVPWFPGCGYLERYKNYDKIPLKEAIDGVEVYHPRFFVIPRFLKIIDTITYMLAVMPLTKKVYKHFPFDLVDLHWTYPDLPTGVAIKKKYAKKMLVTLRGKEAFHLHDAGLRKMVVQRFLKYADHVISLSSEMTAIAWAKGVGRNKTTIIRNGVDTDAFFYIPKEKAREKLSLPNTSLIILGVGSLIRRKGFDRVLKALPEIMKEHPNAKFYIVGTQGPEGDYRKKLRQKITNLQLTDRVVFVGGVKNDSLVYWYNAADLFCLSSRGEGSPNVLTEALACGCPSITTDVGAAKEILVTDIMGKVVSNNSGGISRGLVDMVGMAYDRISIAALIKEYDWDWCANQVCTIYQQVCDG